MRIYNFTGRAEERHKIEFKNPEEFLKTKLQKGCIFGRENILSHGVYREMGWQYDFRPFLKRFIVKQYDDWSEYYCLNKTVLRKLLHGTIQEIREI